MRTNKIMVAILVLQSLVLLGQWTSHPGLARAAHADITLPDPSARQLAMLEELKGLNGKMDRLLTMLQNGDAQVKVAKVEEAK